MDLLVLAEHCHKRVDALRPGFWLFGGADPVEDRIPVGTVECGEERACPLVRRERAGQILGHGHPRLRLVGLLPAAVGPGPFDLAEDRKSTRLNSSHMSISYAVFCLKK